jgi:hypothetical protein
LSNNEKGDLKTHNYSLEFLLRKLEFSLEKKMHRVSLYILSGRAKDEEKCKRAWRKKH